MSDWRRQISLVKTAPIKAKDIRKDGSPGLIIGNSHKIRSKPYPPSFKRIAAKIIDPAIGASTWAFGSHKWTEKIGNLTIKAVISINHRARDEKSSGRIIFSGIDINSLLFSAKIFIIIISKGREAVTV